MRTRQFCTLLALVGLIACESKIHRLLEAPPPPDVRLSVTLNPSSLTLARGAELSLTATVVRVGDGGGPVTVVIEGLPAGVTADVATTPGATGATAAIRVRAAASAPVGNYSLTVRGRAQDAPDATSLFVLSVIEPPDVAISLSQSAISIARGGIARVGVSLVRTNLSAPVALSLSGQSGITAAFPGSPVAGNKLDATISVDANVAPGTYPLIIHGTADAIDRTATLNVNVTADPLQVIAGPPIATPQLSTVTHDVIVNRSASLGSVTLSATGLPAGATATFTPLATGNPTTSVSFAIGGSAAPGTYPVTIRASASGVSDATATETLTITPASIALELAPSSATVSAGAATTAEVHLARTDFSGAVTLDAVNPPAGIAVAFDSSSIRGSRATATVTVARTVAAGAYTVSIRATPAQLSASAVQTASLALTVTPATAGAPVMLDWTGCPAPTWVAIQDGSGPWSRSTSSNNVYQGSITAPVGAVAYVADNNLVVRYMTQAELSAAPLAMCSPVGTRVVRGFAIHATTGADVNSYNLGGGVASSSFAQPNFAISGVPDGVHDLVVTSAFSGSTTARILIRRDIVVNAATTTIDTVNVLGPDGIVPITILPTVTVSGQLAAGETFSSASSLMTTAACTVNPLRTLAGFTSTSTGPTSFGLNLAGVPASSLRANDYYLATATLTAATSTRTSTVAFHNPEARTLAFAPALAPPTVTELAGGYKRLQANIGALPQALDRTVSLQYGDVRGGSVSVTATRRYFDASNGVLTVPDLSVVSGWPAGAGVSSAATGTWRVVAEGATSDGSACVEDRRTYSASRSGTY